MYGWLWADSVPQDLGRLEYRILQDEQYLTLSGGELSAGLHISVGCRELRQARCS